MPFGLLRGSFPFPPMYCVKGASFFHSSLPLLEGDSTEFSLSDRPILSLSPFSSPLAARGLLSGAVPLLSFDKPFRYVSRPSLPTFSLVEECPSRFRLSKMDGGSFPRADFPTRRFAVRPFPTSFPPLLLKLSGKAVGSRCFWHAHQTRGRGSSPVSLSLPPMRNLARGSFCGFVACTSPGSAIETLPEQCRGPSANYFFFPNRRAFIPYPTLAPSGPSPLLGRPPNSRLDASMAYPLLFSFPIPKKSLLR